MGTENRTPAKREPHEKAPQGSSLSSSAMEGHESEGEGERIGRRGVDHDDIVHYDDDSLGGITGISGDNDAVDDCDDDDDDDDDADHVKDKENDDDSDSVDDVDNNDGERRTTPATVALPNPLIRAST